MLKNDAKVGLFILIALVLFIYGLFQAGGLMEHFRSGTPLVLQFENSQQVTPGTAILLLGKKVGRVNQVDILENLKGVEIQCSLEPNTPLFKGMTARIEDKSALGGKIIELVPPKDDRREVLPLGVPIQGVTSPGLSSLIASMSQMLDGVQQQSDGLFKQVKDLVVHLDQQVGVAGQRVNEFGQVTPELITLIHRYKELGDHVDQQLLSFTKELDGHIASIVPKTEETLNEYQKLAGQLSQSAEELKTQIKIVTTDADTLIKDTNALVKSEEIQQILDGMNVTLKNLEEFSQKIADRPSSLVFSKAKKKK